ncbi:hypothetical protein [Marinomonas aquiplantarum]|uniref:Uncharacterized protein n=1 Tax=Marinomonas aquiplantarum TaxID=491951 RepID=A0A366CU98_9GAMM|nr:hypothetical protein [Marinomonas aquiplantarum]RBO79880.1 hypothetical protein DFP76_11059 [Marinomonas aquiplantarum]
MLLKRIYDKDLTSVRKDDHKSLIICKDMKDKGLITFKESGLVRHDESEMNGIADIRLTKKGRKMLFSEYDEYKLSKEGISSCIIRLRNRQNDLSQAELDYLENLALISVSYPEGEEFEFISNVELTDLAERFFPSNEA